LFLQNNYFIIFLMFAVC